MLCVRSRGEYSPFGGMTRPCSYGSVSIPATTTEWEYPNLRDDLNLRIAGAMCTSGGVAGSGGAPPGRVPVTADV